VRKEFASTLSELRRKSSESQKKAAANLGVSQALLSHYENGVREPGLDFIVRAAEYYGVSLDYLLGRTKVKLNPFLYDEDAAPRETNDDVAKADERLDEANRRVHNAVAIVLSLASKLCGCQGIDSAETYFSAGIYHVFRTMLQASNTVEPEYFNLKAEYVSSRCTLATSLALAKLTDNIESDEKNCGIISREQLKRNYSNAFDIFEETILKVDEGLVECTTGLGEKLK